MKVSRFRHERIVMVAGCLLAAAVVGGYSLFAQVPSGTFDAPAQTGTAPPSAAVNPVVPAVGVSAPGTGAPGAPVPVLPLGEVVAAPGAGDPVALPPSVTPPDFGGPGPGAGLAPPAVEAPNANALPALQPSIGGFGTPLGLPTPMAMPAPDAAPFAGGGMMMPGMMSVSPEQALDHEIKNLLKAYQSQAANPAARGELAKTLSSYVAQQFKLRQERREAEIKSIEVELARVKKLHESRVASQEAIIGSRVKELLSTAEGLGWDLLPDDSAAPGSGGYSGQAGSRR